MNRRPDPFLRSDPRYRFQDMFPSIKGKCALCETSLPSGRRRWCSDRCGDIAANRYFIRKGDSNSVRNALWERDEAVCHDCGHRCVVKGQTVRPWQGHHVKAVTEGGGGCDLEGYVTLCNPCHGKHTGALRKRLSSPAQGALL